MKLIIGLGNPGEQYKNNRHNVGFMAIDKLLARMQRDSSTSVGMTSNTRFKAEVARVGEYIFAKPQTFMNASGQAVSKIKNFYKIGDDDIYLIHDDLDIRLGDYKIQKAVGPKVHNGVESVEKELGTKDFWRVRMGVDNRAEKIPGDEYVLSNFSSEEKEKLAGVLDKVVDELCKILKIS